MPASYGVTQAGFAAKPLSAIVSDMQTQVLGTIDPGFDLSPGTPDGQMLGIFANQVASLWALAQVVYNQFNPADVEGAGLDNIGALRGTLRNGATYTLVPATLVFGSGALAGTYPAGAFTANVAGNPSLTFSNASPVVLAGGAQTLLGVVMQASSVGPTATINPSTLTVITTPVTGWTSITNPTAQSQIGAFSELDAAYLPRQAQNLAAQGSCTAAATGAALRALGSAQTPPQTLSVSVLENRTNAPLVVSGILMPANTYAPVIYDGGTGWAAANPTLIAASIYANKPAGITSTGSTSSVIADPFLGNQSVFWTLPSSLPLFISVTVVPLSGIVFANLVIAIQSALVAAAVAPTTSSGIPPVGQLVPGAAVIGSQLETVIQNVPGVTDVQAITFGFSASPVNTLPLSLTASQVATLLASTIATNVIVTQGVGP